MGAVGDFLFGGSQQDSQGHSTTSSQNQSAYSNVQGSQSNSNQASSNASGSANQAFGPLTSALTTPLGYVTGAGNMIGALLGLPPSTFNYTAPMTPSVLPPVPVVHSGGGGSGSGGLVDTLFKQYLANRAGGGTTTTSPPPVQSAPGTSLPLSSLIGGGGGGGQTGGAASLRRMQLRANGGPVAPGQPYVVGENQPEVFVPNQSGTIVPSVNNFQTLLANRNKQRPPRGVPPPVPAPGPSPVPTPIPPPTYPVYNPTPPSPSDAVNTFANNSGMNFILDQGQKAISGASAANGTFNSGATGKALVQYGQQLGQTTLNDYINHLFDFAKLGLGSASALTGAGNVSQGVGSSTGGSTSTSFGSGSGSSSGTSTGISSQNSDGQSKKGLL